MPKVSVLMPSFNCARYLPLAIESVLSQSYSDLELILIDDCSTDGSREIAQEWRRCDSRVVIVCHEVNRGLAAARNSGIATSTGDFIALCDADDIWLNNKLQAQLERFGRTPELGLVHSDSLIIDSNGKRTGQRFSFLFPKETATGSLFEELCQGNFLCVPTVLLRREALLYARGFDQRLRSLEDWVCWTKISRKYPFCYIEDPLVQYRIHGASLSSNFKGMAHNRAKALPYLLEEFADIPGHLRSKMLYALGMSHLELGDSRSALIAFISSIKADPLQGRNWGRCSQVLFGLTGSLRS